MSIYEVHLGFLATRERRRLSNFRELADQLVPYVTDLGYTHIELLPVMEHPLDESWAIRSRVFCTQCTLWHADDLRYLIDRCHQPGIGVILTGYRPLSQATTSPRAVHR